MNEILTVIQVVLMFLVGLVFIFEGYSIEKIVITVIWFLLGFNIAKDILGLFNFSTGIIPFIIEVIVGACFAAVGFKIDRIAFFIAIAYAAFIAIPQYFVLDNKIVYFIVKLIVAIVLGLLAVKFRAIIYVIISSLLGATLMKRAILLLFPVLPTGVMTAINAFVIILVIIGLLSQLEEYQRTS